MGLILRNNLVCYIQLSALFNNQEGNEIFDSLEYEERYLLVTDEYLEPQNTFVFTVLNL